MFFRAKNAHSAVEDANRTRCCVSASSLLYVCEDVNTHKQKATRQVTGQVR